MDFQITTLKNKVLKGESLSFEEALALANTENTEELFLAADEIRRNFNGNKMDLCTIMNAKSGKCSENCKYCAQSSHYKTGISEYPLISLDEAVKTALENEKNGAHRFSLVTSGNSLSPRDFETVLSIYKTLREKTNLHLCASHGEISYEQALQLKEVGVTMYHHNIETSKDYFNHICDTHSYEDRITTIKNVIAAGLDLCCGGIIGMGEDIENRIKMAFEIKELNVQSIPINVLSPVQGTPFENLQPLEAIEILKTMAIFRFILPKSFIRYAGGRKALGDLQETGLKAGVNAALIGNYLTTIGNTVAEDMEMIQKAGFEI